MSAATMIQVALAERGYRESPTNVTKFSAELDAAFGKVTLSGGNQVWRNQLGTNLGMEWCAIFLAWCHWKAFGVLPPLNGGGFYCPADVNAWRKLAKIVATPQPGDFVYYIRSGVIRHVGLVCEVRGQRYSSIEGNTSPTGVVNPDGGGVFQFGPINGVAGDVGDRPVGADLIFARPDYPVVPTDPFDPSGDEEMATLYVLPNGDQVIRGDATMARRVNGFESAQLVKRYGDPVRLDAANPAHETILYWIGREIAAYDRATS